MANKPILGIPTGRNLSDSRASNEEVSLPIPPAKVAVARAGSSAITLSGSPMSVTLNANTTSFNVTTGQYPVVFRYRADGDTNAVTNAAGSYPYDEKLPALSGPHYFAVPALITSLSLDTVTTDSNIVVIEK